MNNPAKITTAKKLTIGKLAELSGVGIDTVRFYERRGLLPTPERTASGYRVYTPDTSERIRFIRRAKDLGFSLQEIIKLLTLHDEGGAKADVRQLTRDKLAEIEQKIDDLTKIKEVLEDLSGRCKGTGDVEGCPIIESLLNESNPECDSK